MFSLGLIVLDTKQRSDASVRAAEELQANLHLGMALAELELFVGTAITSEPVLGGLARVGLSTTAVELLMGMDGSSGIADSLTRARSEIEARVEQLDLSDPNGTGANLGELRIELHEFALTLPAMIEQTDSGELTEAEIAAYYQSMAELVDLAGARAMNQAFDQSAGDDFDVLRDLAALQSLIAAHGALVAEQEAILVAAFGGRFLPEDAGDWVAGIEAHATYEHQVASFEQTASEPLLARWRVFESADNQRSFQAMRDEILDFLAPDRDSGDFEPTVFQVASFSQLMSFINELLGEERERMDASIAEAAEQFSAEARATYRLAFATGIITLLFVVFTARLLLRPLGELRRRAAAMTEGEDGLAPLGAIGPREIAQVAVAMDDVNSNLFVIGRQLDAISDLRFDDEILETHLPGAVGRGLEQSVRSALESSATLNEQARIDALTELPNRLEMVQRLDAAIENACPSSAVAVTFLDLDRFKPVNDRLGHEAGDQVLIQAARRFEAALGENEALGRIGGDEFLAVATGIQSVREAIDMAQRLIDAASNPIVISGREIDVGVSAGVALVTSPGKSSSQVLHEADLGLYESKGSSTRITVVTDELTDKVHTRTATIDAFEASLGTADVALHLQPIVDINSELTIAAEGLLRWTRDGEPVPPGSFIPIIESSDLIHDVGRWVLGEAARHSAAIKEATGVVIPISVNISWHHLEHGDLIGDVEAALRGAGVDGRSLCVEFTESTPPPEARHVARVIEELSAMGVGIWLDDFGTGYTSITQLQDLAFDAVKLDRSFVSASVAEGEIGMTQALIDIITLMHVPVLAEGVETEEELAHMRAAGAVRGQGWYWSRDLPLQQFLERVMAEELPVRTESASRSLSRARSASHG